MNPRPGGLALHSLWEFRGPIARADAALLAEGWKPKPGRKPLPFERKQSGNSLAGLSACSGTGMGFCRYDYQWQHQTLTVVTIPGPKDGGIGAQLVSSCSMQRWRWFF